MATNKKITVLHRRKREGKTNYRKRLLLLQSRKIRLVVRPSLKNIIVQLVAYDPKGDKVITTVHSSILKKFGWKMATGNLPSAYLTGLLIGVKAKQADISEAMLDIGLRRSIKHTRIYACVKGAVDAGLKVPCSKEVFPSEDRIKGKHIQDYADKAGPSQFSNLKKSGVDVTQFTKNFEETKKMIIKG